MPTPPRSPIAQQRTLITLSSSTKRRPALALVVLLSASSCTTDVEPEAVDRTTLAVAQPPSRLENKGTGAWLRHSGDPDSTAGQFCGGASATNPHGVQSSFTDASTGWELVDAGGGYIHLQSDDGRVLQDTGSAHPWGGNHVRMVVPCSGSYTQWKLVDAGSGYSRIENRATGNWLKLDGTDLDTGWGHEARTVSTSYAGNYTRWKAIACSNNSCGSTTCDGDGVVEGNEQCDEGGANGTAGSCCSASCTLKSNGTVCTGGTCQSGVCQGSSNSGQIIDVVFDTSTLRNVAPGNGRSARGSDNWPITWAQNGHQYTTWGDGRGFVGTSKASLGVARIEGGKDDYSAFDLFQTGTDYAGWKGKSKGILAIGNTIYLFRSGNGSDAAGYALEELYKSVDGGNSFTLTGASWYPSDFSDGKGFSNLTFAQFGPGYTGTPDNYVYVYGFEEQAGDWNVQFPGRIALMRVPKGGIESKANYQYFAGMSGDNPTWTSNIEARAWVFDDAANGVMRFSVTYRAGLGKYILMAQQVDRTFPNAKLGIYQADEPWGPFVSAMPINPVSPKLLGSPIPIMSDGTDGENDATKTVFFGISNKWSDQMSDPTRFVMVYTGDWQDEWGSVEGQFVLAP